jgi:hypothetical protein
MSRTEQYRNLASSVRARAATESSVLLQAQWEILAETYVRLAEQPENRDTNPIYDPIWDMLGSLAALNRLKRRFSHEVSAWVLAGSKGKQLGVVGGIACGSGCGLGLSAMSGIEANDTALFFPDLDELAVKKLFRFLHGCFVVLAFNDLRRLPNVPPLPHRWPPSSMPRLKWPSPLSGGRAPSR